MNNLDIAERLERARKNVLDVVLEIEREQSGTHQDADALAILSQMSQELRTLRDELVSGHWEGRRLVGYPPTE